MEIISSKGTLTGEDIKADQCYLLLAYLILNHKKNSTVDTLAEIICPYDELDSPYKVVNNIVYRLRRTLSVIGLDKLVIGKNGTFQINPNFNIHTDFDRFEDACIKHHRLPTHVNLNGRQCGLHNESTIMLEQLRTLDKRRLLGYAGTVGKDRMREVNTALEISIGIKDLLLDNKRKRGSNYGKSEHREEKHQGDPDDH